MSDTRIVWNGQQQRSFIRGWMLVAGKMPGDISFKGKRMSCQRSEAEGSTLKCSSGVSVKAS